MGYLMPKPGEKGKSECVTRVWLVWLEFELSSYDFIIQNISHYASLPPFL